jgi:transcriptional regulator with XRE-family HTH domain
MVIGKTLRELREAKNLSQDDIEHCIGLFRAYISSVENGHTIPTLMTSKKYAGALGVPVYKFFTDDPVKKLSLPEAHDNGSNGDDGRELRQFAMIFKRVSDRDQKLLTAMAQKMAQRNAKR